MLGLCSPTACSRCTPSPRGFSISAFENGRIAKRDLDRGPWWGFLPSKGVWEVSLHQKTLRQIDRGRHFLENIASHRYLAKKSKLDQPLYAYGLQNGTRTLFYKESCTFRTPWKSRIPKNPALFDSCDCCWKLFVSWCEFWQVYGLHIFRYFIYNFFAKLYLF